MNAPRVVILLFGLLSSGAVAGVSISADRSWVSHVRESARLAHGRGQKSLTSAFKGKQDLLESEGPLGRKLLQLSLEDCYTDGITAFFLLVKAYSKCSANFAEAKCSRQEDCSWDNEDGECEADIWQVLLGIPSEGFWPKGHAQAFEARLDQLSEFFSNEDGSIPLDSDPATSFPKFTCLEKINPIVCDSARAFADRLVLGMLYCSVTYTVAGPQCDRDPICSSGDSKCSTSDMTNANARIAGIEALFSGVSDPVKRKGAVSLFTCPVLSEERCVDDCVWSSSRPGCSFRPESFLSRSGKRNPGCIGTLRRKGKGE